MPFPAALLLIVTALLGGCQKTPPAVYFQLSDHDKSLVDGHLMLTTSYSTRTNRLLLPGYEGDRHGNVYRIRHNDSVFVFYQTRSRRIGELFRVEEFDLKGNLIRKGSFKCSIADHPVTLIKVTGKDPSKPLALGVGIFRTYRELTPQEEENGGKSLFGTKLDTDYEGRIWIPLDSGDLEEAYFARITSTLPSTS